MAAALFLVFIILSTWPRRSEIAKAWRQRSLFPAGLYWGVAGTYALSGFIPMFSTFGAPHFGVRPDNAFMQALTAIGLVSLVVVHLVARRLAKPRFDVHAIPARERNEFHGLWMGFWLLGMVVGWLPMFML